MERHPIDNLAFVFGLAGLVSGVFALLHQSGAIALSLASVTAIAVLTIGLGGLTFGILEFKKR